MSNRVVLASGEAGKPSMVVLPNGEILLSYIKCYNIARYPPLGERMEVIRSADGGATWSEPFRATHSPHNDREGYLILLNDGTLLLTFMRVMSHVDAVHPWQGPFLCRSEDGGRAWSEPWQVDISSICPEGPFGAAGRGHAVLPDGRLLLFVSVYDPPERPHEHVLISRNGGETFIEHHFVSEFSGDSSFARLPGGQIVGALRINAADFPHRGAHPELQEQSEAVHFMGITKSSNDGKAWSTPVPVTEYNEIPGHLLALQDGRLLLTFGVRTPPLGIHAVVSEDGGASWDTDGRIVLVEEGPTFRLPHGVVRHGLGHPYTVELPDGRLLTAYYRLADGSDAASCQVEGVFWGLD
ncbi:MAG: exo-alpha-sialidase [Armatimonadetes bacterium]|nr:exo-alpha-sialidase [Armatimonadota bacterium]